MIIDAARFPRDKVCAGWITPDVVQRLELDVTDYASGRVLQPFSAFRLGVIGRAATTVAFDRVVSYGVRRVEFDDYLLRRSGARVVEASRVSQLTHDGDRWTIDGRWRARYLVGAGGHRCPVARWLNPDAAETPVVVAQRTELVASVPALAPDTPELFFEHGLQGYGWIVPKGAWVNIGLGRTDPHHLPEHVRDFVHQLEAAGRLTRATATGWQGHAYLLASQSTRRVVGPQVLLAGDAAGLAAAGSGEGIRSAVLSGLWAADAIRRQEFERDVAAPAGYEALLREQLGFGRPATRPVAARLPERWRDRAIDTAFRSRAFLRAVLERTFLHGAPGLPAPLLARPST